MGIVLLVVFGGLVAWNLVRDKLRADYLKKHQPGPKAVSVTKVETTTYQPTLSGVGTIEAEEQVNVTTESGGKVVKIAFKDGQTVKRGDLLVELNDEVQRAELEDALAKQAQSKDAMDRYAPLLKEGAISQLRYDEIESRYKENTARVAEARAALSFVHVTAPFSGRLGISQVSLGELIQPGRTIVTLDTEGGLYCSFTIPESKRSLVFVDQTATLTSDVAPGETFEGKVSAVDPEVNVTTRNFGVRVSLPTDQAKLTPGAFAHVTLDLKETEKVIMIPRTAIAYTLYGDTVYLLDATTETQRDGETAYQIKKSAVTPGDEHGKNVVITKGLEDGQLIVTSGQLRLNDGDWVTPKPTQLEAPKSLPME